MSANTQHSSHADLVVIGGGLAGLSAAALVARASRSVIVLEQASTLGGRAATHIRHGVHFNLGAHALYCHGHATRLLRELGIAFSGHFPSPGRGLLSRGDRLYTLPQGILSLLGSRLLTVREKWRLTRFLSSLPRIDTHRLDGVSLSEWVEQTAGTGALAALLHTLARLTTYVNAPEQVSAGAALAQLRLALAGNVWYLDGGWQTIIDRLRAACASHGADVRTGARAEAVRTGEDGVTVRLADGAVLRAQAAVLAVPPRAACELLDLPAQAALARWAAGCVPVKAACLDVALDRLPRPDRRFALGLDQPLYYSVHSAAARLGPEGVAVLHLMKYLDSESAQAGDVEEELEGSLDRLQPGWRAHLVARRLLPGLTVAHAIPRAEECGLEGRPDVEVAERPGIFLAGDWVGPEGLLADASAASAESAARQALVALGRPAQRSLTHVTS